jgi:hypothetical protein
MGLNHINQIAKSYKEVKSKDKNSEIFREIL